MKSFLQEKRDRLIIKKINHAELENGVIFPEVSDTRRVVIYTCVTGGYDQLLKPKNPEKTDYVAFMSNNAPQPGWNIKPLPENVLKLQDPALENRYIKMHPFELFEGKYDFTIYIDGNIEAVGDLRKLTNLVSGKTGLALFHHQFRSCAYDEITACEIFGKGSREKLENLKKYYKREGFPRRYGLFECNVIVSDLHCSTAKKIFQNWWEEFLRAKTGRDQVAFPYILWKTGFKSDDIGFLGNNVYKSGIIRVYSHSKDGQERVLK